MSQQVRLAPTTLDVVYVRDGYVTISRADGSEVVVAPGHHPAWMNELDTAFCPPEDGFVQVARIARSAVSRVVIASGLPAGNTLTASAGKVAVHRTDPRRVLTSWGAAVHGATDPAISADGKWLAFLRPDWYAPGTSSVFVMRVADGVEREVSTGAPTRLRFSSAGTSLAWEGGAGQIYGIADVANPSSPAVRLSRPEDSLSHPVPLWVPERGELWVLYVQAIGDDAGTLMLAEWGSCVAQAPHGRTLTTSSGSGYDHDVATDGEGFAETAYLQPDGTLRRVIANFVKPWAALPLPPVPPEPPVTPPIEPPVEPPTPPETDMTHDDVRRYAAAIGNELLFGAYQRFHDEVLARDRPMDGAIKSAAWTSGDPDFWTGDVTTGGAMSIFTRTYMPEAIIAQDNGRTPEQASGDGYDKGIAAYNKAVGVTPPTPPPGEFRGPVSSDGRDFVVPE